MNRIKLTSAPFLIMMGLFFSLLISSCKEDEVVPVLTEESTETPAGEAEPDPGPTEEPAPEPAETPDQMLAKKWVVNSVSNGRISNNESDFRWFEFTLEGYYIVQMKDETSLTGSYTADGQTISMEGLGTLVISAFKDNNFNFTFTAEGSAETISIFTTEAEKLVSKSANTDLLCKTWTVSRQHGTVYGMKIDQSYPNFMIAEYTAVFSVYGTYVLAMTQTDGTKQIFNRMWRWKNAEETMICYGDTSSECTGENETTVMDLSETSFNLYTRVESADSEIYDELTVYKK